MVRVKVSGIGGQSRWITGLAKSNEEVRIAQAALEAPTPTVTFPELTPEQILSVNPPHAVVSKVRPNHAVDDIRTQVCALGNFFSSAEAAADWLAPNPDGKVVTIAEDFEVTKQAMRELGWAAARR